MPDDKAGQEIHELLLQLWDKAVGTPEYDREQWRRFQELIWEKFPPKPILVRRN
jgi:hypothetical protein